MRLRDASFELGANTWFKLAARGSKPAAFPPLWLYITFGNLLRPTPFVRFSKCGKPHRPRIGPTPIQPRNSCEVHTCCSLRNQSILLRPPPTATRQSRRPPPPWSRL